MFEWKTNTAAYEVIYKSKEKFLMHYLLLLGLSLQVATVWYYADAKDLHTQVPNIKGL